MLNQNNINQSYNNTHAISKQFNEKNKVKQNFPKICNLQKLFISFNIVKLVTIREGKSQNLFSKQLLTFTLI